MTEQTPATEAGRDLMRALKLFRLPIGSDMYPPDVAALAADILAIEAEARADGMMQGMGASYQEGRADALKEGREDDYYTGRADALREAADAVLGLTRWAMVGNLNNRHMAMVSDAHLIDRAAVLAILEPEAAL